MPLVYDRLRALARSRMRGERADQTLQATALVHEAYLRLVDGDALRHWDGRWHFFSAAAEAMRRRGPGHRRLGTPIGSGSFFCDRRRRACTGGAPCESRARPSTRLPVE
jgi:hypothetical protein